MSFVEGMCGRGVSVLGVCSGFLPETCSWTMRGGLGGDVLAQIAEVVRTSEGVVVGLVHGYLAGAIDTMFNYKEIERGFVTKC